jgi:flagellar basal body-associated protein FliL
MESKKTLTCIFIVCLIVTSACALTHAQPSLSLSFYKNNGYGMGNDIGGIWTVTAVVSSNTEYVEFYLDNQLQQNDTSAQFSWQFDTSNYPTGAHTIKAVAYDAAGESTTATAERNFQEASTESVTLIILVAVIVIVVAAVGFAIYWTQKSKK